MQSNGKIILKGNFKNTGFGFSCMQYADTHNVYGEFEYLSGEEIEMRVSGTNNSLKKLYEWCLAQQLTRKGDLILSVNILEQYNEFQIINQL